MDSTTDPTQPIAADPVVTADPAPVVATDPVPVAGPVPTPDSVEGQLASLTLRVAALESEIVVAHAQVDPSLTLGDKVHKLFITIFGSDNV
jgi:hypothetical protein